MVPYPRKSIDPQMSTNQPRKLEPTMIDPAARGRVIGYAATVFFSSAILLVLEIEQP